MSELLIRHDPPRPFLCLSGVIFREGMPEQIGALISRFHEVAAGVPRLGSQIALYHPQGRDPFGPDGEPIWIGREVIAAVDAPSGVQMNWTPGGDVAVLVHEGAYETVLNTHFALHRAVREAGRKLVGPNWERYTDASSAQLRTEVCYSLYEQG